MTEEIKKGDMSQAFHTWRHENEVTKLYMKYLAIKRDEVHNNLLNLSERNIPAHDKLIFLGAYSECLRLLVSIIEMDLKFLEGYINE
jgi:hypothetical protein